MLFGLFFFFKQKTAYEMRMSDWSSDVCSSDLVEPGFASYPEHGGPAVRGGQGGYLGRAENGFPSRIPEPDRRSRGVSRPGQEAYRIDCPDSTGRKGDV